MTWLTWRQHRSEALIVLLIVLGFSSLLLIEANFIHGLALQNRSAITDCLTRGYCSSAEDFQLRNVLLNSGISPFLLDQGPHLAVVLLPGLFGAFVGAPLVAREIEHGTHRLAWTQGITRLRWLTAQVGVTTIVILALTMVLTVASTLWMMAGQGILKSRWQSFDAGPVLMADMLYALALGVFAGTILRRVVPAMALTVGVFTGLRVAVMQLVRPHLLPPLDGVVSSARLDAATAGPGGGPNIQPVGGADIWTMDKRPFFVDSHSNVIDYARLDQLQQQYARAHPDQAPPFTLSVGGSPTLQTPHAAAAASHFYADNGITMHQLYQPANHFWPIQGLESLIFVALALLLFWLTAWLVRRRAA